MPHCFDPAATSLYAPEEMTQRNVPVPASHTMRSDLPSPSISPMSGISPTLCDKAGAGTKNNAPRSRTIVARPNGD